MKWYGSEKMTLTDSLRDIVDLSPLIGTSAVNGVRYNPLKLDRDIFLNLWQGEVVPAKYYADGFRVPGETAGLGNHPLHLSGGCYFQEPSAMSAITAMDVQNGETVLDLCAAPGSKATALAAANPDGITVVNEIHPKRANILLSNIERMGLSSVLVTRSDAAKLRQAFGSFFDRVLVDAPCSGEGMFRKYPEILTDWTPENVSLCAARSREILEQAAALVRPGGRLVYSTCTFNEWENEKNVLDFLSAHPEFSVTEHGIPHTEPGRLGLTKAARIFPSDDGEGHFVCALQKNENAPAEYVKINHFTSKSIDADALKLLSECGSVDALYQQKSLLYTNGDNVYLLPPDMPKPEGIYLLRAGVLAACRKGKTYVPCQHFYTALPVSAFCRTLAVDDQTARRFCEGQTLDCAGHGFTAVVWNGLTLGFGKAVDGTLKNHYPKGLRLK